MGRSAWFGVVFLCCSAVTVWAQPVEPPKPGGSDRQRDVIYGRKAGLALTMDVFTPKGEKNGAAVFYMVSGGFFSSPESISPALTAPLLSRGYTVFCVVHGSQPVFTVPEAVADVNRAVRFVRANATKFGVDPQRFAAAGGSAGGHLSLMLGCAGGPGDPKARDPIDRESSKVQCVACFFPATDLLNYGREGNALLGPFPHNKRFRAAFDHRLMDAEKGVFERVTDEDKLRQLTKDISPISFVSASSAPCMIIHGDKDDLVPLQQSETFVAKMKAAGAEAELVVKKGAGHGWATMLLDVNLLADWCDKHVGKAVKKAPAIPSDGR